MAKKKTQKIAEVNLSDGLHYQGNVKVSIVKNKKVLSTNYYHNTGYINLFKFICNCLAGVYDDADRPCKIVLYTAAAEGGDTPSNPDFSSSLIRTATAIYISTSPVVKTNTEETNYTVTYHFSIPYAFITTTNTEKIYKAALLKNKVNLKYTTPSTELLASYCFTKNEGKDWDPITINKTESGNYDLVIEWTMTIKN